MLEEKMILRQDDIVRALTKRLADREEVNKNFRLTKNYAKSVYDLVKVVLIIEDKKNSSSLFKELKEDLMTYLTDDAPLNETMQLINYFCVHNSIF